MRWSLLPLGFRDLLLSPSRFLLPAENLAFCHRETRTQMGLVKTGTLLGCLVATSATGCLPADHQPAELSLTGLAVICIQIRER